MPSFAILWVIWRERNDKIFRVAFSSSVELITSITMRIAKWALVRKEFSNFYLDEVFVNWESCLGCGPIKVRGTAH